jgi:hypothetical protein
VVFIVDLVEIGMGFVIGWEFEIEVEATGKSWAGWLGEGT